MGTMLVATICQSRPVGHWLQPEIVETMVATLDSAMRHASSAIYSVGGQKKQVLRWKVYVQK